MAQLRPKIVKLCKVIGGLTGMVNKIDENAPEYYSLANIVTDDEADVAIAVGLRKNRTAAWLAKKVGKPVEEVEKLAKHLAWIGIFRCTYNKELGVDEIARQTAALADRFESGVRDLPGVRIVGGHGGIGRTGIVAINVGDIDSAQVADALGYDYGICVRAGAHCAPLMHEAMGTAQQGAVRFSFSHFNTAEEVDDGIAAIAEIAG